jgi:hypothetical protein
MSDRVLFTSNGKAVTEEMLRREDERWEAGDYPGTGWGKRTVGRPRAIDDDGPAETITFRPGKARVEKLERLAKERGLKDRSEVLRQLIDAA